jgi:HEAT repeat protein
MTRGRKIGLIALGLVASSVMLTSLLRDAEPAYAGRSARSWFSQARAFAVHTPFRREAEAGFIAMGDAAVPFLWEMACCPRTTGKVAQAWAWLKQRSPWRSRVPAAWEPPDILATEFLGQVRPSAAVLWPLIAGAIGDPAHPHHRLALHLAGALGEGASNAVPALVRALDGTNSAAVFTATHSLGRLGPAARDAVPALIKALDQPVAVLAAQALGSIGPEAGSAIPRLEQLGSTLGGHQRVRVAFALCRIDPHHPSLSLVVTQAASRVDLVEASAAIASLGQMGPAARPALPVLLTALADPALALPAVEAVHRIDPTNTEAVPLLLKYLAADDLNAASWLARWEPPHEAGIAALAKVVQSEAGAVHRVWAMDVLYGLGPRARSAVPALERAARDPDPFVREAARCTLRRVNAGDVGTFGRDAD